CPATWILDHPTRGTPDLVVDQQDFCVDPPCSTVSTTLTLAPCSEPFETQNPQPVTVQFSITNEFEETFSASTTFACWASFDLGSSGAFGINDIFNAGSIGGSIVQTRMRSFAACTAAPCPPSARKGVMAVIEETHTDTVNALTARNA